MKRKHQYIVTELVTRVYTIYADDMTDAIDAVYEIDDSHEYEDTDAVFDTITEVHTGKQRIF